MRGRFVAIVRWQPIHVRTLGSPATGPSDTALVAVLGAGDLAADVDVVWKLERLLDDDRMAAEEVVDGRSEASDAPS